MPVVKCKPTSPGRRFVIKVVNPDLHKGEPYSPLLATKAKTGGRNNAGRITRRHAGGGHKQKYRVIDFCRSKDGITAKVERLEYDPNRTATIALLLYADGERRYVIAPQKVAVGDELMSGAASPMKPRLPAMESATSVRLRLINCPSPVRTRCSSAASSPVASM